METIKIIIADDNKEMNDYIRNYMEGVEEIEVLGSCYSDKEETYMIDNLKPEIVITDIVRNNTLSGLEIIKKYKEKGSIPKFLVITAGEYINPKIMDGYIKKPITDYNLIVEELRRIKQQILSEKLLIEKPKDNINIINSIWSRLKEKIKKYRKN